MARRRKDNELIGLIAQLVGVAVLVIFISPQVRHLLSAAGFVAVGLAGVTVIGMIGLGFYKFSARSRHTKALDDDLACQVPRIDKLKSYNQPQTTADLIEQLRRIDWFQFEMLMGRIYGGLGYTVTRRGGANPDGGIDLIIEKDGVRSAVQCKHWKTWNVGVKSVREFLGALTDSGIEMGIFITLGGSTDEAKRLAAKHGIKILNDADLARMIESMDIRFDPEILSILKDARKVCPKCEREMVLRTATKGSGAGRHFWGCSSYPTCRFTMPAH